MEIGETLLVSNRQEWREWLAQHHHDRKEIWLIYYKKTSGKVGVSYEESVEEALCFGWIDGQAKSYDDESRVQRFTPRRARSVWSKLNTERVERLVAHGRMRPAGLAEVDVGLAPRRRAAAGRDGRDAEVRAVDRLPDVEDVHALAVGVGQARGVRRPRRVLDEAEVLVALRGRRWHVGAPAVVVVVGRRAGPGRAVGRGRRARAPRLSPVPDSGARRLEARRPPPAEREQSVAEPE